ncbi:MAG: hypothetical protein WD709_01935, partial [Gammaproteobacteria bacterium]
MNSDDQMLEQALKQAWHEETARNSLERWTKLGEQQNWAGNIKDMPMLVKLFGASWYFTRFIFALGPEAITLLTERDQPQLDKKYFLELMQQAQEFDDIEQRVNRLRVLKNTCMLRILVAYLRNELPLEQLEAALTELAEVTLDVLIRSFQILPQHKEFPVTILGMGRMAGYEMTFGSDLDLIFLYEPDDQDSYAEIGKTIRLLLRTIAQPASAGLLYEVDMRLRPHGNSGPLVTSYNSFLEHHSGKRDVWEKQMMTRCRPVLVLSDNLDKVMSDTRDSIYSQYDKTYLRNEIVSMRMRVQKELGSPKDKYEIKRGYGGIMDIDFISHYYQLAYGHEFTELQTGSTRLALTELVRLKLVDAATSNSLIGHYNYLKKVEMCLRLFDMKSVDSFTGFDEDNIALSRAMGHGDNTR